MCIRSDVCNEVYTMYASVVRDMWSGAWLCVYECEGVDVSGGLVRGQGLALNRCGIVCVCVCEFVCVGASVRGRVWLGACCCV